MKYRLQVLAALLALLPFIMGQAAPEDAVGVQGTSPAAKAAVENAPQGSSDGLSKPDEGQRDRMKSTLIDAARVAPAFRQHKLPQWTKNGPVYSALFNGDTVSLFKQDITPISNGVKIEDRVQGLTLIEYLIGIFSIILFFVFIAQALNFALKSSLKLWVRLVGALTLIIVAFSTLAIVGYLGYERSYRQWCELKTDPKVFVCKEERYLGVLENTTSLVDWGAKGKSVILRVKDLIRPRYTTGKANKPEFVLFLMGDLGRNKAEITQDVGEYDAIFQLADYISEISGISLEVAELRTQMPSPPKSRKSRAVNPRR